MYYRNAQSALVVYDVTKPTSFIKARHWVNELKAQANKNIIIALVGNKVDLVKDSGKKSRTRGSKTGDKNKNKSPENAENGADGVNANENLNDETTAEGTSVIDEDEEENDGEGQNSRKVAREEGEALAKSEGLLFFETSAKSGLNVSDVFLSIANKIPEESSGRRGSAAPGSGNGGNSYNGRDHDGRVDLTAGGNAGAQGCNC